MWLTFIKYITNFLHTWLWETVHCGEKPGGLGESVVTRYPNDANRFLFHMAKLMAATFKI